MGVIVGAVVGVPPLARVSAHPVHNPIKRSAQDLRKGRSGRASARREMLAAARRRGGRERLRRAVARDGPCLLPRPGAQGCGTGAASYPASVPTGCAMMACAIASRMASAPSGGPSPARSTASFTGASTSRSAREPCTLGFGHAVAVLAEEAVESGSARG